MTSKTKKKIVGVCIHTFWHINSNYNIYNSLTTERYVQDTHLKQEETL